MTQMTNLKVTVVTHTETPTDKSPNSALLLGALESFSSLFWSHGLKLCWSGPLSSIQFPVEKLLRPDCNVPDPTAIAPRVIIR